MSEKQEPIAWGVMRVGGRMMAILDAWDEAESLRMKLDTMENWVHEIVPLYHSPALTNDERDAVETAALEADAHQHTQRAATLRGLLERQVFSQQNLTDPRLSALQQLTELDEELGLPRRRSQRPRDEVSVRPACSISPAWMARPFYVDPASGWQYGFPKLYDPAKDGDMTEWMVANGYPKHLADQNLPCTFTAFDGATTADEDK